MIIFGFMIKSIPKNWGCVEKGQRLISVSRLERVAIRSVSKYCYLQTDDCECLIHHPPYRSHMLILGPIQQKPDLKLD
jgi:hypothetical protein